MLAKTVFAWLWQHWIQVTYGFWLPRYINKRSDHEEVIGLSQTELSAFIWQELNSTMHYSEESIRGKKKPSQRHHISHSGWLTGIKSNFNPHNTQRSVCANRAQTPRAKLQSWPGSVKTARFILYTTQFLHTVPGQRLQWMIIFLIFDYVYNKVLFSLSSHFH